MMPEAFIDPLGVSRDSKQYVSLETPSGSMTGTITAERFYLQYTPQTDGTFSIRAHLDWDPALPGYDSAYIYVTTPGKDNDYFEGTDEVSFEVDAGRLYNMELSASNLEFPYTGWFAITWEGPSAADFWTGFKGAYELL